eukprot:gene11636-biopygen7872
MLRLVVPVSVSGLCKWLVSSKQGKITTEQGRRQRARPSGPDAWCGRGLDVCGVSPRRTHTPRARAAAARARASPRSGQSSPATRTSATGANGSGCGPDGAARCHPKKRARTGRGQCRFSQRGADGRVHLEERSAPDRRGRPEPLADVHGRRCQQLQGQVPGPRRDGWAPRALQTAGGGGGVDVESGSQKKVVASQKPSRKSGGLYQHLGFHLYLAPRPPSPQSVKCSKPCRFHGRLLDREELVGALVGGVGRQHSLDLAPTDESTRFLTCFRAVLRHRNMFRAVPRNKKHVSAPCRVTETCSAPFRVTET